jgi:hypothetical protein
VQVVPEGVQAAAIQLIPSGARSDRFTGEEVSPVLLRYIIHLEFEAVDISSEVEDSSH